VHAHILQREIRDQARGVLRFNHHRFANLKARKGERASAVLQGMESVGVGEALVRDIKP
jgi:hypothetical protein